MNGILNEEYSRMLANSADHYLSIQHQEKLHLLVSEQEMLYVKTYNLVPFKDGDSWCVLLGKDLQTGISGFGDTPIKAILDFNKSFLSSKK